MSRRSGYHYEEESDIISPRAALLHGGSRSGPPRQGYGPGSGGAGPSGRVGPSGRAGPPGRARQGNAYDSQDILDDEEMQTPRRPFAGGRPRHNAEETSFVDGRPSARRHNNVSGRPHRSDERDSEYEHSGAFSDRRTPARGRLNHFEDGQLGHVDDDDGALGAVGARPSRRNPIRQGPRDSRRAQGTSEDNERYGGSQRGGGNRARERSEDDYGNPDPRLSRALAGGRSMRRDEKQDSRFVQYTFEMLDPASVDFLVQHWQVPTRHLKDWFDNSGLEILVDRENDNETNTKEIVARLASKYPKVYGKAVLGEENLGHIGYRGRATTGRRNRNPDYTHSSR